MVAVGIVISTFNGAISATIQSAVIRGDSRATQAYPSYMAVIIVY